MVQFGRYNFKFKRQYYGWYLLAFFLFMITIGALYDFFFFKSRGGFLIVSLMIIDMICEFLSIFNTFFMDLGNLHPSLSFFKTIQFQKVFGTSGRNFNIMRNLSFAAPVTLRLSVLSMALGFFIALFIATILSLPKNFIQRFAQLYIDYHRSTPLLVQLLIIYIGVPPVIQGLGDYHLLWGNNVLFTLGFSDFRFSEFNAALVGLTLNTGAYQAEIIRGGIGAIPSGQTEAARGLGMNTFQTMRFVILPQAVRLIIPPLTNEAINVILNSSLASVITVFELALTASTLATFYFNTFDVWIVTAMFYFIMAFSLAKIAKKFEKRYRIPGLGMAPT